MKHEVIDILKRSHDDPLGGHFEIRKTYEKLKEKYYWKQIIENIKEYISSCDICQRYKGTEKGEELHPIKVNRIFERIGIDIVGPLPETHRKNKYIIVAIEYLTKWPEAKLVKKATSFEVAKFLYEEIICKHGVPSSILSDRGTAFLGRVVGLLKQETGFRHKLAAAYYPQTNSLTERFNGTLCLALAKCVNDNDNQHWDDLIPSVLFAYRTLKHSTTKQSPFYLMYGREAQLPINLELSNQDQKDIPYEEALQRRISHILSNFTDSVVPSLLITNIA